MIAQIMKNEHIFIFWTKFEKIKNDKTKIPNVDKLKKYKKLSGVYFSSKLWTKNNFWRRNFNFQSHLEHQIIRNLAANNMTSPERFREPKLWSAFLSLICPLRTFWARQWIDLDLSCSEHFFWLRCDSYNVRNGLISIFPFSLFFQFWFNFNLLDFKWWFCINFEFYSISLIKSSPSPLYNSLA